MPSMDAFAIRPARSDGDELTYSASSGLHERLAGPKSEVLIKKVRRQASRRRLLTAGTVVLLGGPWRRDPGDVERGFLSVLTGQSRT